MDKKRLMETTLSEEDIFAGRIFDVHRDKVRLPRREGSPSGGGASQDRRRLRGAPDRRWEGLHRPAVHGTPITIS